MPCIRKIAIKNDSDRRYQRSEGGKPVKMQNKTKPKTKPKTLGSIVLLKGVGS